VTHPPVIPPPPPHSDQKENGHEAQVSNPGPKDLIGVSVAIIATGAFSGGRGGHGDKGKVTVVHAITT
jgi:hypothetical protein